MHKSNVRKKYSKVLFSKSVIGLFLSTLCLGAVSAKAASNMAVTDKEVTIGILHSSSGTMAISETGAREAEILAIEQINASGGVLGRKIKYIYEDGASDWPTFAEKAKKLLESDHVAAIMGCWTSASRKAVLPVLERDNGLLYYPTFYEGLEQSKNVVYTGQEATQQVFASLDWLAKTKHAKTFYLVGSDYIWPRTTMKLAREYIERVLHGKIVGEEYAALGSTQFGSTINKIKLKKPDVIYAAVVGGSNVSFYKQLKASGVTGNKQTLLTLSTSEDEVDGIGGDNVAGFYSAFKYFETLDTPENKKFVSEFHKRWGANAPIGDVTQAAYEGPWLWKKAVEMAGSFETDKVVKAEESGKISLDAPEGMVYLMPNHHLKSKLRIGEWRKDGQADIVYTSDYIIPNPFPKGY
ncbi:MAG: urea ABC transporter substrate-binding protein [Ferrovum sp. 37-45-19]|uniref:transporter substrate-binding protein n=1 Tax=Ferrovum sp. JA12 TaxID=1356299 RepID=UPI000714BF76|nr:transporter substrate-binding protein [Ferrovum sp. JA12]OYV79904.1 MAG: urea ABC transporter substrate-binding protein [Ferrovum sp. 21-44-67]OYV95529.1 MAG: urea ABC transporter substrate-binding protein [Ferrovum sp. 37-45-19]OZB31571.1 MAG: urea ABC transporter substrate-binding protein [Ferrovum sp. 34-44-207]HQT81912.1 transporter substrate-binding protein [Ferrovaceae bacterium]KRH78216.1 aliphatic amidase expression-regulating protein [Ferrovum sp. JA12]